MPDANSHTIAIACANAEKSGEYQALAQKLRQKGVFCEVFLEGSEKQLVKQYMLAEKRGLRYVLIPGENTLSDNVTLRDLPARQNAEMPLDEAIKNILTQGFYGTKIN